MRSTLESSTAMQIARVAYSVSHTLLIKGFPQPAMDTLEHFVREGIDHPSCWLLMARCKAKVACFSETERALEFSMPTPPRLSHQLHDCCVYASLGHFGEAMGVLRSVTSQAPETSGAWLFLGDMACACHQSEEALVAYQSALEHDGWMGLDASAAQLRISVLHGETQDHVQH